jgi:Na+/melibiose symporter and related transporters
MSALAHQGKLPFRFILLWATKSISVGMSAVLMMQFTFYATDVVGLDAGFVGILMLTSKLLDAAIGLVVGFLVDRTHTRWGKGRPYDLFLIPMWICVVLLFSAPEWNMTGKAIYVFAFYSLANAVLLTLLGGGESAYIGRAIPADHHRARLTSVSGVLVMLVCTVGSVILPLLMATWGTQPNGWRNISLAFAAPMCILGMLRFMTIKEKSVAIKAAKNETIGIREGMRLVLGNRYVFVLAPASLLCSLAQTISSIVATYYFTYIVGDLKMMSYIGMIGIISPLVLLLFPLAIRTIGGMNFVRIGLVLAIVGNLLKLLDLTSIPVLIISQLLSNTGLSSLLMMQGYFLLQSIDYGEQIQGKRVEGLSAAINGLYSKIGAGLASVLIGGLMGVAGYVNLASQQPSPVIQTIVALYSWIPAVLCVLMLITVHFYDLDKKQIVH